MNNVKRTLVRMLNFISTHTERVWNKALQISSGWISNKWNLLLEHNRQLPQYICDSVESNAHVMVCAKERRLLPVSEDTVLLGDNEGIDSERRKRKEDGSVSKVCSTDRVYARDRTSAVQFRMQEKKFTYDNPCNNDYNVFLYSRYF